MKKIIKGIAILFAVIGLAGCAGAANGSGSGSKDITINSLTVNDRQLGGEGWHYTVSGNTITWLKDFDDCGCGWNLTGIDFSEYKKVRIELESYEGELFLTMCNNDWTTTWNFEFTENNVFEADLTGEGNAYQVSHKIDKSKGFNLFLQSYIVGQTRPADQKVVVKSIEFLKE